MTTVKTVKFCKNCDNLLYPKEDADKRSLVYGCHNCDHQEPAESNIVYYKELPRQGTSQRRALLNKDPILPKTKSVRCPSCGHGEATFFQAALDNEVDMKLIFICCNPKCGGRWQA